jgi:multidrug efflux pump subunit AcrA (membrane-fusion protein)
LTITSAKKRNVRVELVNQQTETQLINLEVEVNIPKNKSNVAIITTLTNVTFNDFGKYLFKVFVNEKYIGEKDIKVMEQK